MDALAAGEMPMAFNLAQKLIHSHLVTGGLTPG